MKKFNRIAPAVGAEHYKTFQVTSPMSTHTRSASCEEVECAQYLRGWRMKIDSTTGLGQRQASYIKHQSGRSYKVIGQVDGLIELEFAPNQDCFQEHRVGINRQEVFRVKGGDFRGNPLRTPTRVHKKPEYWVEEFQEHQDRIKSVKDKG